MARNWAAVDGGLHDGTARSLRGGRRVDERLKVAFNDVDFCLRLLQRGLRNLVTPYAQLYHHESASRGFSLNPVEVGFMKSRWGRLLENDPYYNPQPDPYC